MRCVQACGCGLFRLFPGAPAHNAGSVLLVIRAVAMIRARLRLRAVAYECIAERGRSPLGQDIPLDLGPQLPKLAVPAKVWQRLDQPPLPEFLGLVRSLPPLGIAPLAILLVRLSLCDTLLDDSLGAGDAQSTPAQSTPLARLLPPDRIICFPACKLACNTAAPQSAEPTSSSMAPVERVLACSGKRVEVKTRPTDRIGTTMCWRSGRGRVPGAVRSRLAHAPGSLLRRRGSAVVAVVRGPEPLL